MLTHASVTPIFSNISIADGLSQLNVTCIFQDKQGYLWMGTKYGLNKFNGKVFEVYHHHPSVEGSISNDQIGCIAEDKEENIWVGTANGLNKLDKRRSVFRRYYPFNTQKNNHNMVFALCIDNNDDLWIGTQQGIYTIDKQTNLLKPYFIKGLTNTAVTKIVVKNNRMYVGTNSAGFFIFDMRKKTVIKIFHPSSTGYGIPSEYVKDICIDKKGNIWVGSYQDGIAIISPNFKSIRKITTAEGITDNHIRRIVESPNGYIWVATYNGLNIINPRTYKITVYNSGRMGNLSHYSLFDIFFDRTNTAWIGTYAGGVDYIGTSSHLFDYFNPSQMLRTDLGILGPAVEKESVVYICSEGGGLISFNLNTKHINHYGLPHNRFDKKDNIKTILLDGRYLLCGTGVGQIYLFNPSSHSFELKYQNENNRPIYYIGKSISGNYIVGGISSKKGFSIISSDWKSSIISEFYVKGKGKIHFRDVLAVYEISRNVFLIGTKNEGLFYFDNNKHILKNFDQCGLSINSILKDSKGHYWIGSADAGLCELILPQGRVMSYNEKNGLKSNYVCKVLGGTDNTIWFSTLNSISKLDLRTSKISNYGRESGLMVDEFTQCAGIRLQDGRFLFAGNNGFEVFNPKDIIPNKNIPPIVINRLLLNNTIVVPGGEDGILSEDISFQKKIKLKYNQTNITIEYCALNYIFNSRNEYMYKLEGFDRDWNKVGNRCTAFYTNIPPGNYIFKVKGSNNDGVWNENPATLEIEVLTPPWRSWWAYFVYITFIIVVGALIFRYYNERRKLQSDIRLKKLESDIHEKYYQDRNRLFTSFSHELRTPLTLIKAPLEDIMKRGDIDDDLKVKTTLMLRNTKRMMSLVNNLMDLQKNESGQLKLHISKYDITKLADESVKAFHDLAMLRNINLVLNLPSGSIFSWFDWEQMEKVYFNILSNAFKYTPNDGLITVCLDEKGMDAVNKIIPAECKTFHNTCIKYIIGSIKNSGSHINNDDLKKIFLPFYQSSESSKSKPGSGIGLSLSSAILALHHGILWAENDSEGVSFNFVMPTDKSLYPKDSIIEDTETKVVDFTVEMPDENDFKAVEKTHRHTILVVEDSWDMNKYITSSLIDKYNVVQAKNGEEGLKKAVSIIPDLIITDVMMPKMDGIELTKELKSNIDTSRIPIIMLTAKTTDNDIKTGLMTGADDYIIKPFESTILRLRVDNLINTREKLKEKYAQDFSLASLGFDMTPVDERFMQTLYKILMDNIDNSDMNLDSFCRSLGLSKSNCYRKIKHITGMSPNEFIRKFRLDTAAKMLKETDKSITDIYLAVGFSSPAYFSNCFRAQFGMSPTEYKNKTHD